MTSVIYRNDDETPWHKASGRPISFPHSLEESISMIKFNGEPWEESVFDVNNEPTGEVKIVSPNGFYFLDDDMIRT